jgi:hypothetical protein
MLMPPKVFALMLSAVIASGALTVWLFAMLGPSSLLIALPLFMIATVVLGYLRR